MQNYILIGAGGTGSHLLPGLLKYLAAHHRDDEWQMGIFDGDAFDAGNVDRQLFSLEMTTVNKATAMAEMYSGYPVKGIPVFLGHEEIQRYVQDGDVVLICADNHTVRRRIELRAYELDNITVISGGNEETDGTVQLFIRREGRNVTPPLSYMHPEITIREGEDRAEMDCLTLAQLPGGGQTILANIASATHMLTALWRAHIGIVRDDLFAIHRALEWTELQFDLRLGHTYHLDQRLNPNWERDRV